MYTIPIIIQFKFHSMSNTFRPFLCFPLCWMKAMGLWLPFVAALAPHVVNLAIQTETTTTYNAPTFLLSFPFPPFIHYANIPCREWGIQLLAALCALQALNHINQELVGLKAFLRVSSYSNQQQQGIPFSDCWLICINSNFVWCLQIVNLVRFHFTTTDGRLGGLY